MKSGMNLDLASPEQVTLEQKVAIFKNDPDKMKEATEFVDELLENAKRDAEAKVKDLDRFKTVTHISFCLSIFSSPHFSFLFSFISGS